jgi:hypothetical protein
LQIVVASCMRSISTLAFSTHWSLSIEGALASPVVSFACKLLKRPQ